MDPDVERLGHIVDEHSDSIAKLHAVTTALCVVLRMVAPRLSPAEAQRAAAQVRESLLAEPLRDETIALAERMTRELLEP